MTLIWIRKAAMCGRVPRETQKKSLWLPHRPHTNKHWLQRTTQTDHKCAGAGAVLCLSSRRNTLVGGLLDPEAGARACSTKGGSQRPQSRLQFCASFSAFGRNMQTKWQRRRFYTSWIYNKLVPCLCVCLAYSRVSQLAHLLIRIFLRYTHQFFASSLVIFRLLSRVYWNSLLWSTSVPPHMLKSLPISDWKHAPAQHHPNHLLSIHTRFTQVAQLPSSLHLLASSSPSLQLFPQQSHPKLQPSQESCPGAHGCLLD